MDQSVKSLYIDLLNNGTIFETQIKKYTTIKENVYTDHLVYQVFVKSSKGRGKIINLESEHVRRG